MHTRLEEGKGDILLLSLRAGRERPFHTWGPIIREFSVVVCGRGRGFLRSKGGISLALGGTLSYTLMGFWRATAAAHLGVYHQEPWPGQGWGRCPALIVAPGTEAQSIEYEPPIRYDVGYWNEEE